MNSEKVQIEGRGFCYDVHVGRGLVEHVGPFVREKLDGHRAAIVTDSGVPREFIGKIESSLSHANFQVITTVVQQGEKSKSLPEVERICGEISELDRSSILVGVGGGVVGDLSGFVAAVFHRGIPHVQIPTTLLAMVDSAIGGKTGVNLPAGKNLIGAIHHPSLVIADPDAVATLPLRELRQAYAEIVKHAIIRDAEMFSLLKTRPGACLPTEELIARNIRIKAEIVSADDRDIFGRRALLNFGHTIGHGIERATDFECPHGECVSLGVVAACGISVKRAGLPRNERDQVVGLLESLGLPTRLPRDISRERISEAVMRDKKFENGDVRFVVTPRIGQAFVSREVTIGDIRDAIGVL